MLKFISRRTVAENTRFSLHFDELKADDGFHIKDYLVVSPKSFNAEGISGVGILALHQGKVVLLRIHRPAYGGEVWEIPRGFVDGEETSLAAARRELEEETGLITDEKSWKPLGFVIPEAGVMSAKIAVFVAEDCRMGNHREVEFGLKSLEFVDWEEACRMAMNSEIADPCTIVALFRYNSRLVRESV